MNKTEMRRFAKDLFKKAMGLEIALKNIVLLESAENSTGLTYLFFAVGNNSFAYHHISPDRIVFYPNWEGKDGCIINFE